MRIHRTLLIVPLCASAVLMVGQSNGASLLTTVAARMEFIERIQSSTLYFSGNHYPDESLAIPLAPSSVGQTYPISGPFYFDPLLEFLQFRVVSPMGYGGVAGIDMPAVPGINLVSDIEGPAKLWAEIDNLLAPTGYSSVEIAVRSLSKVPVPQDHLTVTVDFTASFYGAGEEYTTPEPSSVVVACLAIGVTMLGRPRRLA